MANINLLEKSEITTFDSPCKLSDEARKQFFIIPPEQNYLQFKRVHTKIGYILQKGYFLSQGRFFLPSQYHEEDIVFITLK